MASALIGTLLRRHLAVELLRLPPRNRASAIPRPCSASPAGGSGACGRVVRDLPTDGLVDGVAPRGCRPSPGSASVGARAPNRRDHPSSQSASNAARSCGGGSNSRSRCRSGFSPSDRKVQRPHVYRPCDASGSRCCWTRSPASQSCWSSTCAIDLSASCLILWSSSRTTSRMGESVIRNSSAKFGVRRAKSVRSARFEVRAQCDVRRACDVQAAC